MKAKPVFTFVVLLACLFVSLPEISALDHSQWETIAECIKCHPRTGVTHARKSPEHLSADLPLDSKGRMLCVTCHDCIMGRCVLRKEPVELCKVCHDCTEGMGCVLGVAHMGYTRDPEAIARKCGECHQCTAPVECIGRSQDIENAGGEMVSFDLTRKGSDAAAASARIVLYDGKLACISCHDPYHKRGDKRLSIKEGAGNVCMACHPK